METERISICFVMVTNSIVSCSSDHHQSVSRERPEDKLVKRLQGIEKISYTVIQYSRINILTNAVIITQRENMRHMKLT